ncbi:hypothetical protein B0H19DRAFT_1080321 [Mycena capillaripes]|nr:hypothetical protein B0H19DRAFT_1080321 [Mycena capillaripes]
MSGGDKTRRSARARTPAPRGPTSTTIPLPVLSVRQCAARAPEPQPDIEVITSDEDTAATTDDNDPFPITVPSSPKHRRRTKSPMDVDESISASVIKIPRPAKAPASCPSARAADLFSKDMAVVPRPRPKPKAAASSSRPAPAVPKPAPVPAKRVARPVPLAPPPIDLSSVPLPPWASIGVPLDLPVCRLDREVDRYYHDPPLSALDIAKIHQWNRDNSHPRLASCTKKRFVEDCWPLSDGYKCMQRMGSNLTEALAKSFINLLRQSAAFLYQAPEIVPPPDLPSSDNDPRWHDKADPELNYVAYFHGSPFRHGDYILHILTRDLGPPDPMLEILSGSSLPARSARSRGFSPPPPVASAERDHGDLEIDSGAVDVITDPGSDASSDDKPMAAVIPPSAKGNGKANPAPGPIEEPQLDGKYDDAPACDHEYEFPAPPVNEDRSRAPPSHGWPWCLDCPHLVDGLQKWFVTGQSLPERSFFIRGSRCARCLGRDRICVRLQKGNKPPSGACNHCRTDGATCSAVVGDYPWEDTDVALPKLNLAYGLFIVENLCETGVAIVGDNFPSALVAGIRDFVRDGDPPSNLQEGDADAPVVNFDVSMEEVAREAPSSELAPVHEPLWFPNLTPTERLAVGTYPLPRFVSATLTFRAEARKAQNEAHPGSRDKGGASEAQWFRETGFGN